MLLNQPSLLTAFPISSNKIMGNGSNLIKNKTFPIKVLKLNVFHFLYFSISIYGYSANTILKKYLVTFICRIVLTFFISILKKKLFIIKMHEL